MSKISGSEILSELRSSNDRQVNQIMSYLYARLYPAVRELICSNSGTGDHAKDVFQDGIIVLYKLARREKIANNENIEGYLYSICRNLWLKELRKSKKVNQLTDVMSGIAVKDVYVRKIGTAEQEAQIQQLLGLLGRDCHYLLNLYYYDRQKMKEIAGLMNLSSEQVAKNKKTKCMKKLRKLIVDNNINRDFFK